MVWGLRVPLKVPACRQGTGNCDDCWGPHKVTKVPMISIGRQSCDFWSSTGLYEFRPGGEARFEEALIKRPVPQEPLQVRSDLLSSGFLHMVFGVPRRGL